MLPGKENQNQAWKTVTKHISTLYPHLVDASESELISGKPTKCIKFPASKLKISRIGFFVLICLNHDPSIRPSDIAKNWGVSKGAISGVMTTLGRAGYITQNKHTNDRRVCIIKLTDNGKKFFQTVLDQYSLWLTEEFNKSMKI